MDEEAAQRAAVDGAHAARTLRTQRAELCRARLSDGWLRYALLRVARKIRPKFVRTIDLNRPVDESIAEVLCRCAAQRLRDPTRRLVLTGTYLLPRFLSLCPAVP